MTRFAPRTRTERHREQSYRNGLTQQRTYAELRDRHLDEYREIYQRIRTQIYAERGPLPGDDITVHLGPEQP